MAKTSLKKYTPGSPLPKWKSKWPRNDNLREWLLCMIEKCEAFDDPSAASSAAHLPIEHLAEIGHSEEALQYVNQFLRKQPIDDLGDTVGLSRIGAKICLDRGELESMERYLSLAAAAPVRRKCDRGWPEKAVRDFRCFHGLLNPADAVDEEQRIEATFRRGYRQFCEAIAQQQQEKAASWLKTMHEAMLQANTQQPGGSYYYNTMVKAYGEYGDLNAAREILQISKIQWKYNEVPYWTLWKVNLKDEALERMRARIISELEELSKSNDPNIHFRVGTITSIIEFMLEHGMRDEAKAWLEKTLNDMENWPGFKVGWINSAVYQDLASVVASIHGNDAAKSLLGLAEVEAKDGKPSSWRSNAISSAFSFKIDLGSLDDAIAEIRKQRPSVKRREMLAVHLARAKRWEELAEVCGEAATPKEAAKLCWKIKFELPGGEVKRW